MEDVEKSSGVKGLILGTVSVVLLVVVNGFLIVDAKLSNDAKEDLSLAVEKPTEENIGNAKEQYSKVLMKIGSVSDYKKELNEVEKKIEDNEKYEEVKVLVGTAEKAQTKDNLRVAGKAVESLREGERRVELQERLDKIGEEKSKLEFLRVIAAIEVAERTGRKSDYVRAVEAVENIVDVEKQGELQERLSKIRT